jgi:hypothetical protein
MKVYLKLESIMPDTDQYKPYSPKIGGDNYVEIEVDDIDVVKANDRIEPYEIVYEGVTPVYVFTLNGLVSIAEQVSRKFHSMHMAR